MTATRDLQRGSLLATLLAGSWRRDVSAASISSADLEAVLPLVVKTGVAGLAWRRIRSTAVALTETGRRLWRARLAVAAEAAMQESEIERLLSRDCFGKFDPILVKGWAHARLFPERGLRRYGDLDLFVQPSRYEQATRVYANTPRYDPGYVVDLQAVWIDLPDRSWSDILGHSTIVPLRSARIRILGPEDALRLACFHLLRHAVEMPPSGNLLWLCDVGVMLEYLPPDFDWDYCLAGHQRRAQWMLALIRLANHVLDVRTDRVPSSKLPESVPSWLVNALLRTCGHGLRDLERPFPIPLGDVVRDVRQLPRAVKDRWPSPLQSVYRLSWPINSVPGRLAQIADYTTRALTWGTRLVANQRGRAADV